MNRTYNGKRGTLFGCVHHSSLLAKETIEENIQQASPLTHEITIVNAPSKDENGAGVGWDAYASFLCVLGRTRD